MRKIILLLLFAHSICFGQIPDPLPNTYVNDLTGKLTAGQLHSLNEKILAIEKKSSVQIAVVLVDRLPAGVSIEDYAMSIGRKWHVGNANNGLVYVAAIEQRKQRLEVATALEHQLTDVEAYRMTNNVKPFFRKQDYYGGIDNLLKEIGNKLDPILQEQLALAQVERNKKDEKTLKVLGHVGFFGAIAAGLFFAFYIPYTKRRRKKREEGEAAERAMMEKQRFDMAKHEEEMYAATMQKVVAAKMDSVQPKKDNIKVEKKVSKRDEDDGPSYVPVPYSSSIGSSSSSSSSSSSDYGDWGSGSSGSSSSSDSGYSGGGSSNDW